MRTIIDGWDAFELWLTGLPFVVQVLFVTLVVLPACALVAIGADRATRRFDTPRGRRDGGT